jgi:hypothetical protein
MLACESQLEQLDTISGGGRRSAKKLRPDALIYPLL